MDQYLDRVFALSLTLYFSMNSVVNYFVNPVIERFENENFHNKMEQIKKDIRESSRALEEKL
ncbi:hypothetical protein HYT56_00280 [Candidatus Woesearchaeota archaeon]|nr:hypothetical protein [Candidatus Woesearchaeota archaeon]